MVGPGASEAGGRAGPAAVRRRVYVVAVLTAAIGVIGSSATFGLWHGSTPVSSDVVQSGTVTLTVDGVPGSITLSPVAVVPIIGAVSLGHRAAAVANAGNVPIGYVVDSVDVSSTPPTLAAGLTWRISVVGDAGQCAGATPGTELPVGQSRQLGVGAGELVCVTVTVPDVMNAAFSEGVATFTLTFVGQST